MDGIFKNQSGAALVIALIMMIVLTVIGLASVMSSTYELRLSGNTRGAINAFYATDGASQAARNTDVHSNFTLPLGGSGYVGWVAFGPSDLSSLPASIKALPEAAVNTDGDIKIDLKRTDPTTFSFQSASTVGFTSLPTITIYHTNERTKPRGIGESALGEGYDYEYYITDTVGIDQEGSSWTSPSKAELVEKIALIVPPREGGS
jgi:type II secretory pathway pseudopilin PulG